MSHHLSLRRVASFARCLLSIRVAEPPPVACGAFRWILPPPDDGQSERWRWFLDGSMLDEPRRFARRTGFGLAVVYDDGHLVAYGCGRPPAWVTTAAGAEAWAYCMVLSMTPAPPRVVTDCLEVCKTLAAGKRAATAGRKRLARVWVRIHTVLEGDVASALSKLNWMPAHGTSASIGRALKLDGTVVTALEWRANRLVDALAKHAAAFDRVPQRTLEAVSHAGRLAEYSAALLGTVTECANNWKQETVRHDGTPYWRTVRDSAPPPRASRPRKPLAAPEPQPALAAPEATELCPLRVRSAPAATHGAKRTKLATAEKWREEAREAAGVSRWLARTQLRPGRGATAAERMQSLQQRVREQALGVGA